MTSNATLSRLTTDYASMLSGIVKNISQTYKFNNFDTAYIDLPTENSKIIFFFRNYYH